MSDKIPERVSEEELAEICVASAGEAAIEVSTEALMSIVSELRAERAFKASGSMCPFCAEGRGETMRVIGEIEADNAMLRAEVSRLTTQVAMQAAVIEAVVEYRQVQGEHAAYIAEHLGSIPEQEMDARLAEVDRVEAALEAKLAALRPTPPATEKG